MMRSIMGMGFAAAALALLAQVVSSAKTQSTAFAVPFTDDVVLQMAPAKAAVYGLTMASKVIVSVSNDLGNDVATYADVEAQVMPGDSDTVHPTCQMRCLEAGHCCVGQVSACQKPSCAMGCFIASASKTTDQCKSSCRVAADPNSGCTFTVVSPSGPFHLAQDKTQNATLQMCNNGPITTNGTQCSSCGGPECEEGCDFGFAPRPRVWKALLEPMPAGGSYTIKVTADDEQPIFLRRVTFGSVFFCSGQSNMDLALQFTFSKPQLDAAVRAGKYDNIRLFQYGDMGVQFQEIRQPAYVTTTGSIADGTDAGGTWANLTTASRMNPRTGSKGYNLLSQFSATCFYFASTLTDMNRTSAGTVAPIGLIQSAVGGSQIEAWMPIESLSLCQNQSLNADGIAPPARLFQGMVAPFVNFTLEGLLWYQGENNVGGTPGNSAQKLGYGCQLPAMIDAWRRQWSSIPGTTHPQAPFGVVSLAAGGSEGHDTAMAHFRWSQSANYGSLPNEAMPNTFLAHAYDLGDPMDNLRPPCINQSSALPNMSAFGPNGPCVWPAASAWNTAILPLRDVVFANKAPSFMGEIHPRFKHEVGRRLAAAFLGHSGPTISGCSIDKSAKRIHLSFKSAEKIQLRSSPNLTAVQDSSLLMVCSGAMGATASDCTDVSMWTAAPLVMGSEATSLDVDLSSVDVKPSGILGIRYGWPLSQGADTCCPGDSVQRGLEPCVPASCPILTAETALPANPFYATIDLSGRCKCLAPQVC